MKSKLQNQVHSISIRR